MPKYKVLVYQNQGSVPNIKINIKINFVIKTNKLIKIRAHIKIKKSIVR